MLSFCRLCLLPESDDLPFVEQLCYCSDENVHQKCLKDWIEKSGTSSCGRCHCQYNMTLVPRSVANYIVESPQEFYRLVQKALRLANIVHLTWIILYVIYLGIPSTGVAVLFCLLIALRLYFNVKTCVCIYNDIIAKYSEWKVAHYAVILNDFD